MKLSDIQIRDPFILPYDGRYYLYFQPGKYAWSGQDGFYVIVSDDLENWSEPEKCFTPPEGFWATNNYWAPEVHLYKGKFYMFASFTAKGHMRAVQILVSDKPEGPFIIHSCPLTPNSWMCLDGTFYLEDDIPYMIFCHEWKQTYDGEICLLRLSDDLKKPIGEPKLLFKASESGWASDIGGFVTDGPFIHKTADGELIMTWSSDCGGKYSVGVAKSSNGKVTGKWEHSEKVFSGIDGGHGMIFKSFEGQLCFTMHHPNKPFGSERTQIIPIKEIEEEPYLELLSD